MPDALFDTIASRTEELTPDQACAIGLCVLRMRAAGVRNVTEAQTTSLVRRVELSAGQEVRPA